MKRFLPESILLLALLSVSSCSDDKGAVNNNEDNNDNNGTITIAEAIPCLVQMVEGCADIANEVGVSKIGEPYDFWMENRHTEAVYAVESWYSWHSRDDYSNNILSIANTYAGSIKNTTNINSGGIIWNIASNSLASFISKDNPTLDKEIKESINTAWIAIQNIPQPFRNNINSSETVAAMEACADLEEVLSRKLETYIMNLTSAHDTELNNIVVTFVDDVVLPTYRNLNTKNEDLLKAVKELANVLTGSSPMKADFSAACTAWLEAREPWEKSEAFLFGPVDALGLDPNMDSWPLDQDEIVRILTSGNFDDLDWSDGDTDDEIEAVQNVRGFHTLEYLLFKNGQPRKMIASQDSNTDAAELDITPENAKSWANYMIQVATLLVNDASDLYDSWSISYEGGKPYADIFKSFEI